MMKVLEINLKLEINLIYIFNNIVDKPSKPQGPIIVKEIRQDRVTIEWRPPIDDGGVELERYIIEKCEANKEIWTKVGDVDKEVENFCAQKLQQDVDYLFRIVARNTVGPSDPLESEPIRTRTLFGKKNCDLNYIKQKNVKYNFTK